MRQFIGYLLFFILLFPYFIAFCIEIGSIIFMAACEATLCSVIDKENWKKAFYREIDPMQ